MLRLPKLVETLETQPTLTFENQPKKHPAAAAVDCALHQAVQALICIGRTVVFILKWCLIKAV